MKLLLNHLTAVIVALWMIQSMSWYTEGAKTAPAANTVLAQTPTQAESNYPINFVVSSSLGFVARLEVVNSSAAVVYSQLFGIPSLNTLQCDFPGLDCPADGFFRIVANSLVALVVVQASIKV